jgi:hypothetical protein
VGQNQHSTLGAKLEAKLQKALWRLEEVEQELRAYEEGWGGSPLKVNPAAYTHDWVMFSNIARARSRYLYLLERRRELRERIRRMGGGA